MQYNTIDQDRARSWQHVQAKIALARKQFVNEKVAQQQMYLLASDRKFGAEAQADDVMRLGHYVNPELTQTSDYYRKLDAMMQCVQRHASLAKPGLEDQQDKVCAKEYKNLRLSAFKNEVIYNQVNSVPFGRANQESQHFSPY